MKGIKKTICLLLSLIMILSMGVPAFAFDNATNEAQANTTTSEASPFSIEISTDKSSYSATGIAKITAKVTNTSGKDIKNVSAEAVFGELAPCKKNSSKTTAEAETLKDGESLEFTYSATINKNAKKLNIFQRIILWFVRLFKGGYSAKDNGFDNGREFVESSNDIKFGKHTAVNIVKVWFGEFQYFSAKDVENREMVRSSLNSLMSSDEYQKKEEKHKIKDVKKLLSELEKKGLINNISYNSDTKRFSYYFTCGGMGTVSIKSEKKYLDPNLAPVSLLNKNQTRQNESISKSVADSTSEISSVLMYGYDIESYELQLDNTWKPVERLFDTWTELCNSKNMSTTIIDCPTVYEFKTALLNKDFICIFEHGNYGGYIPNTYVFMVQNEEVTRQTDLAYNKDIYFERIITDTDNEGNVVYLITPQFFEYYYKNKLTESIVYMLSCQGFGKGVTVDYGIADTLINDCGAKAVLGFHNSVAQCYGYQIYDKIVNSLLKGFTIGEAYDSTIDELGATDYTFLKNHLFDEDASTRKEWLNEANRKKEEEEIATFSLQGDKTARLNVPKDEDEEKTTKIQGCVRDSETKAPIANAKVELRDGTNFNVMHDVNGKYHVSDFEDYKVLSTTTTDENGKYTFNMPSGKYVVAVYHDDYEFNGLYFSFEKNLDGYFPTDILLVPNGDGGDDREIIASGDCGAEGDNVKWILYDDGELVISGSGKMKDYSIDYSNINTPWNEYRKTTTKLKIYDGVTSIGNYSFTDCNISSAIIPNGIKSIGDGAFYTCKKLKNISIPNSVIKIGIGAFCECDSLSSIEIPQGIEIIETQIFKGCDNLTDVVMPDTITYIDKEAFYGCHGLKNINISNNLTNIEDNAFYGCTSLINIELPNSVKTIGSGAFSYCEKLKSVLISDNVTSIGESAFRGCKRLTSIVIPNSISEIKKDTFNCCYALNSVIIPASVKKIGACAFLNSCYKSVTIYNPDCVITDNSLKSTKLIYGFKGSTAQAYAKALFINFISLD